MEFIRKNGFVYFLLISIVLSATFFLQKQAENATSAAAAVGQEPLTILVDAGHGGEDGGARSCTGAQESTLNLEIALRVNDLYHLLGYPTKMVRSSDVSIHDAGCTTIAQKKESDLKNRVKLVNETPRALLVSIHQNQFSESKYYGAQVFFAPTTGSEALAKLTQEIFNTQVDPSNHRAAKPSTAVYLMSHIRCTGILVECGFLSNRAEEAKLHDAAYQKRIAAAICGSVSRYLTEGTETNEA